jgi:hypothetical protein
VNRRPSGPKAIGLAPGPTFAIVRLLPSGAIRPTSPVRNPVQNSEPSGPVATSSGVCRPLVGPNRRVIAPERGSTIEIRPAWALVTARSPPRVKAGPFAPGSGPARSTSCDDVDQDAGRLWAGAAEAAFRAPAATAAPIATARRAGGMS